jgi:hypothetical protein
MRPHMHAPFFGGADGPVLLDSRQARSLAEAATDFRALYDFNMQHVVVSREVIKRLRGGGRFFRSPFPDYYAMNLVFAECARIAVDPQPRVVIGITCRSHGYFHFNRKGQNARALLHTDEIDPKIRLALACIVLPGTNINTSWLLAMGALYGQLGGAGDLRPNYGRYRRLQRIYCEQAYHLHRTIDRSDLRRAQAGLPWVQRALLPVVGPIMGAICGSRRGRCDGPAGRSSASSLASTESRECCPTSRLVPRHH